MTAPTGSTVTATLDGKTTTATESSGTWTFTVHQFGTYTINATLGDQSAETTVSVTEEKTYEVSLAYTATVNGQSNGGQTMGCYIYATINGVIYGRAAQWRGLPNNLQVALNTPCTINITPGGNRAGVFLNETKVYDSYTQSGTYSFNITADTLMVWAYSDGGYNGTLRITMPVTSTQALQIENDGLKLALQTLGVDTTEPTTPDLIEGEAVVVE